MLDRMMRIVKGNYCRIEVGRTALRATCDSNAQGQTPTAVWMPLTDGPDETLHELSAAISTVLGQVDGRSLRIQAIVGDDLVRYFMVTPPENCTSMLDLRSATDARFQGLYGESVAPWHVVGDWRATEPFLACAVPSHVIDALRQAVAAQRAVLVSITPAFIDAWNRSRRDIAADAWPATWTGEILTLGLVVGAEQPRLAAVRMLALEAGYPSMGRLCEQVAYAALLEGVEPPVSLHVHGMSPSAAKEFSAPNSHGAVIVRWHATGDVTSGLKAPDAAALAELAQRGVIT